MLERSAGKLEGWQETRARAFPPALKLSSRLLSLSGRTHSARTLAKTNAGLPLRGDDRELGEILQALDQLSMLVRSKVGDTPVVDQAIKRVAQSAVKQSLHGREVHSLAVTDELTGFFNRRGFMTAATQQLRLARRDRQNVLLLFCDVDDLKGINDSFGHGQGDLALFHTAGAIAKTFRDSDVLARLGGDEFAILAWEASIPNVQAMLSRLEKNLKRVDANEPLYQLSLSVGVARFDPLAPVSLNSLIAIADQDMYKHKSRRYPQQASRRL
jgi:diguanylate cyclase (GGDEF)-like protein